MANTTLTADRLRELLNYDPDTGVFVWRVNRRGTAAAGTVAGSFKPGGYRRIKVDCGSFNEHRLAWLYVHGRWPVDQIDHINGDPSDNRIANLREATHAENMQNRPRHASNTSGYPGVTNDSGLWRARIRSGGRRLSLGVFDSAEEAAAAYRDAEKALRPFRRVA